MTARVLVVDDILPNVKLLEAKLSSEYFDVLTATSGPEALDQVHRELPDIVLLDVMMPGMNGFDVCRRIKEDPETTHIPVVMVSALDQQSDRITGLKAGADDFLTKPVKDVALFARVKSLVRLKVMMDEIRNRESTEMSMGVQDSITDFKIVPENTNILLIDDNRDSIAHFQDAIKDLAQITIPENFENVAERAREKNYDLAVISLKMGEVDGLRICSKIRSFEETRQLPILVIVDEDDTKVLVRALDMGVNDYLIDPPDATELTARVTTQLKRKRFADKLRENLHMSMRLATTDAVTGLFNRHYMTSHLETLVKAAHISGKPLSLLIMDIDHFKKVNDTYGHAMGDEVLQEFSHRIARNVRGVDMAARYGGEEFVVIMPDTKPGDAMHIAERLRATMEEETFKISNQDEPISVTSSVGLATMLEGDKLTPNELITKADEALYHAKDTGRNRVVQAD